MIKILESLYTLCNFRYEVSANTPPAPEKIDTTVLVHARNHADRIEVGENQNYRRKKRKKKRRTGCAWCRDQALTGAFRREWLGRLAAGHSIQNNS